MQQRSNLIEQHSAGRRRVIPAAGLLAVLALLSQLLVGATVLASHGAPSGFAGNWTTIDCATWWEDASIDCDVWGDGSTMTLHIGHGDMPRVRFQDSYAGSCANAGGRSARWTGAGYGELDVDTLWLTLTKSGCGTSGAGGITGLAVYHDPGSDTLWEDEDGDGWGLVWYRTQ